METSLVEKERLLREAFDEERKALRIEHQAEVTLMTQAAEADRIDAIKRCGVT